MKPIILNNLIDNYEGSISYQQFRFALFMYGWKRRKSGLLLLCPCKCRYRLIVMSILLKASFIAFCLCIISFTMEDAAKFLLLFANLLIIISYLHFDLGRMRRVYIHLPKMPIAVINLRKRQITVRRNLPCVQIGSLKLTLDFNNIKKISCEESLQVKNGLHVIHFVPWGESIFSAYVKGMYLHYTNNGQEAKELFLCGQYFNNDIYEKIFRLCNVSFY